MKRTTELQTAELHRDLVRLLPRGLAALAGQVRGPRGVKDGAAFSAKWRPALVATGADPKAVDRALEELTTAAATFSTAHDALTAQLYQHNRTLAHDDNQRRALRSRRQP